jgi:hypothetical protein
MKTQLCRWGRKDYVLEAHVACCDVCGAPWARIIRRRPNGRERRRTDLVGGKVQEAYCPEHMPAPLVKHLTRNFDRSDDPSLPIDFESVRNCVVVLRYPKDPKVIRRSIWDRKPPRVLDLALRPVQLVPLF